MIKRTTTAAASSTATSAKKASTKTSFGPTHPSVLLPHHRLLQGYHDQTQPLTLRSVQTSRNYSGRDQKDHHCCRLLYHHHLHQEGLHQDLLRPHLGHPRVPRPHHRLLQ
ncbi:LOW QUALITY PROTEIN: hypothetical protein TorRG33x02_122730 [Trema orientale]|uniref:Uncharacterized protein n=1 Tax=Trema orientale TaxID=63057 RepID=A0A2P5F2E2_TREOI|nr:LOW QUALITY PROTEIN: hypothetical protein TorRG33x02_122730 [Trema orientale]